MGADYKNAVVAIKNIADKDINKLPRKNYGDGKDVFNKIVDINTYEFFDSTYYNKQNQYQSAVEALDAIKSLLILYYSNNGTAKTLKYSNELASCSVAILFLLEKQTNLVLGIVGDTSKFTTTQKNGYRQFEKGLNTVVSGILTTIEKDYPYYEKNDIIIIATYFFPYYNRLKKILSQSSLFEFNRIISDIEKNHPYLEVRALANKL